MEVDVAVLGGGPGGYTAAIRAAQLGAKVACIEKEPELGGTCLRVGCIPTKAWVQTAHFLHQANENFAKLGVKVDGAMLDFGAANEWKAGVVKQMTTGVAGLFKANGVEWVKGAGTFKDASRLHHRVHFRIKDPIGTAPLGLCAVHREVRTVQQLLRADVRLDAGIEGHQVMQLEDRRDFEEGEGERAADRRDEQIAHHKLVAKHQLPR